VTEELNVAANSGIISTGFGAHNTVNQFQLPPGGLRAAGTVDCAPRTVGLGPHTAGRLFVGRADELTELDDALAEGSGVITTGLGGVGKSTLAHHYATLHRDRYNPIWWIDAEEPVEIEAGLAALARRLYPELAGMPDPDAGAWGRAWLSCHDGWLVILDNAAEPAHVADLIGEGHGGRFLLTSRLTTGWEELAKPVPLGVLMPGQALELMTQVAGSDQLLDGAEELCEALGYLPLAVRLAAAYMKENNVTAQMYLSRLTSSREDVLAWTPAEGDTERTVARIWKVGLERITTRYGELPQTLLRILAWFAPTDIPVTLLHSLSGVSDAEVDQALGRLAAYAMITRDADAISVHRMLQAAARHQDAEEPDEVVDVQVARGVAIDLLNEAVPPEGDPEGWPVLRRFLPHIDALSDHTDSHSDDSDALLLFNQMARYLEGQGELARSIAMFERIAASAVRIWGPEHPSTFTLRSNLASAYLSAGEASRAIPLCEQALVGRERILGPDHPSTLTAQNNLAFAYVSAGDVGRAIPLHEQTLADFNRILGSDHPSTLSALANLAYAYVLAGEVSRAIPLYEQAVADRERVLGRDHPDTLTCRNNLAGAYGAAGDVERAISLYEQTLVDFERVLGPDHPSTLICCNNLAGAYASAGEVSRAIPLYEQTLANAERSLGPDHPVTRTARTNLEQARLESPVEAVGREIDEPPA
jgi:tetratricopeptide (TPR) repeat protein